MTRPNDASVGERLDTLEKTFTRPQLFRFSAVRWNPHRVHYDRKYATEEEGQPDVLVHGPLHEAAIQQLLLDWVGSDGRLLELSCRIVGRAVPEEPYLVEAEVTAVDERDGTVEFDVWTHQAGERCADGSAVVRLER
jgi:hydroxyacyl-ACP dehydratase HTD2-like protein with hotdog domain